MRASQVASVALWCASVWVESVDAGPLRLSVNGSQLLDPDGAAVRLTGFNWVYTHLHDGDGELMKQKIPGSNVVRAVGLLWDNIDDKKRECYSDTPPYLTDSCLDTLDNMVKQATDAGVWVIITCRSKYGAGQEFETNPMGNVFHNETLRNMMYTMWQHVAAHYASWDYIAAYEIMSEPRDKSATAVTVHDFFAGGCSAVHAVDPVTPCMVGPGSYYKLYLFTEDIIIADDTNVIYTFDYFDPDKYVFGESAVSTYPGVYPCNVVYKGWATAENCPHGATADTNFDATWHAQNFKQWLLPIKEKYNVPIFVNQWEVVHGVTAERGRFQFMTDVAKQLQDLDIGWAWWVFRGGGDGWSAGSSELVYQYSNGTLEVDDAAVSALAPYMSGSPSPAPGPAPTPPSPTPPSPPSPTPPSPTWTCQAGQGGSAAHQEVKTSRYNSEAVCGSTCTAYSGCVAFDYTSQSRSDSCRLFATTEARLGDGGSQNRMYCAVAADRHTSELAVQMV